MTRLAAARDAYRDAERAITGTTAALGRRPAVADVPEAGLLRYIAEGDAIRDNREEQREKRRSAELAAAAAEHTIADAKRQLELVEARGRTRLIDDLTPLNDRADEVESFNDALTRVRETIASVDLDRMLGQDPDSETSLRARQVMNVSELAGIYGVRPRTVERWISGARKSPIVRLDDAIVRLNQRATLIDLSALEDSWWAGLTVCQREQVEQLLRIPIGATRYGGTRSTDAAPPGT
jgi:hypothetical protein